MKIKYKLGMLFAAMIVVISTAGATLGKRGEYGRKTGGN